MQCAHIEIFVQPKSCLSFIVEIIIAQLNNAQGHWTNISLPENGIGRHVLRSWLPRGDYNWVLPYYIILYYINGHCFTPPPPPPQPANNVFSHKRIEILGTSPYKIDNGPPHLLPLLVILNT